jgi:hypothetical protein
MTCVQYIISKLTFKTILQTRYIPERRFEKQNVEIISNLRKLNINKQSTMQVSSFGLSFGVVDSRFLTAKLSRFSVTLFNLLKPGGNFTYH